MIAAFDACPADSCPGVASLIGELNEESMLHT